MDVRPRKGNTLTCGYIGRLFPRGRIIGRRSIAMMSSHDAHNTYDLVPPGHHPTGGLRTFGNSEIGDD